MTKAYHHLIGKAMDIATLSTYIARNADYKEAMHQAIEPELANLIRELEIMRRRLQDAIKRQMDYAG